MPIAIKSENLAGLDGQRPIRHGFFTRQGGVSTGIYEGLNIGLASGDDKALVQENRRRVAEAMGVEPDRLATPHQVHSPNAIVVDAPFGHERPKADAVVTATPGVAAAVLTADCGPVLFADTSAGIVAAAHAGWRGALGGVLEETVRTMESLGASRERITATLGPTISQTNYEVDDTFKQNFLDANPENILFFEQADRLGHARFDLPAYILSRLKACGVSADWSGHCTYGQPEQFFSYRRSFHRQESDYGRQIAAIAIVPDSGH